MKRSRMWLAVGTCALAGVLLGSAGTAQADGFRIFLSFGTPAYATPRQAAPLQVWVPGHYETQYQQVLTVSAHWEKVLVPGTRRIERAGRGQRVVVEPAHWENVWAPAKYENRAVSVWVPGHYETQAYTVSGGVRYDGRDGRDGRDSRDRGDAHDGRDVRDNRFDRR